MNSQTAAVAIAPDRCTVYLAEIVEQTLATMPAGQVLEVRCGDGTSQLALADWCLESGRRIRNPFAHYLDYTLLIENSAAQTQSKTITT